MSFEQRVRVSWSPRGERSWCPGALKPTASEDTGVTGGWTQFFKRSVVDRLRRAKMAEGEEAGLPQEAEIDTAGTPLSRDESAV